MPNSYTDDEEIEWSKVITANVMAFISTTVFWLLISPFLNLYPSGMNTIDLPFFHIFGTIILYLESKIINRLILQLKGFPSCLMTSCQLLLFFTLAMFLRIGGVF